MSRKAVFRSFTRPLISGYLENEGQLPVLQELEGTDGWVLWISLFLYSLHFRGPGIYFSYFHKATMFGWPRKSRSTSGFWGTPGYCRFGLMDFSNFLISIRFLCQWICLSWFHTAVIFEWPRNSRSTSGFAGTRRYWRLGLMDFRISLFPTFSRSRNLFLVVSQSYHVQVTSKIQVNFRFRKTGTPGYCRLGLMDFSNFFIPYVFDVNESVYRSFTQPLGSSDLGNPGQLPVSEVL